MTAQRYSAVAIVLHWAIASAILFMIPLGFWMHEAVEHSETVIAGNAAFQLHKSIGLTVLALSLMRLGWRFTHKPPPLPPMPAWEKFAARATHALFYVLIIGLPLTGWLYVSTGWSAHEDHALPVTTYWFHLFRVPALFDLPHAPEATRRALAFATIKTHWALAWGAVGLVALHVAAALKHQIVNRDETLAHMIPGLKAPNETAPPPKNPARLAVLGAGFAAIAVSAAAAFFALTQLGGGAAPPAEAATNATPAPAVTTTAAPPTTTALASPSGAGPATPAVAAGPPPTWTVNHGASGITFGAVYHDDDTPHSPFHGDVGSWRADIRFDPANLEQSRVVVTIDLASIHDDNDDHNRILRTEQWLGAAGAAEFRTTSIRHVSGDNYEARGTLTIRGHALPITLPFTLTITGNHASMRGRTHIDPRIDINVHVEAARG